MRSAFICTGATRVMTMPAGMMALSAVFHCAKSGASASVLTSTHSHSLSCPSESGQAKVI